MRFNIYSLNVIILTSVIIFSGCSNNEHSQKENSFPLVQTTNPTPTNMGKFDEKELTMLKDIKKDVSDLEEIYDVVVVKGKEDILVAYKVKHLQRFRMKKIEKKIKKKLKGNYPDENFTVSSDYKIFLEAVELNEKMKDPGYSNKKAEKQLQKIIKLKKELT